MTQFNISDTFNLPENATTVSATIRLTKNGEEVFASVGPIPVAPPDPAEVFAYSGTFENRNGSNQQSYRSTGTINSEGFETEDEPLGQIIVDGRLSSDGTYQSNTGIRWKISLVPETTLPNGDTIQHWEFYRDYLYGTQSWTLIVNSTDGTVNNNSADPAGNFGTTTWKYIWSNGSPRRQSLRGCKANLQLDAGDISILDSDVYQQIHPWWKWLGSLGTNPTFELSVGGRSLPTRTKIQ